MRGMYLGGTPGDAHRQGMPRASAKWYPNAENRLKTNIWAMSGAGGQRVERGCTNEKQELTRTKQC